MRFDRVFLLVLDGVGVGALPDAASFGDAGAATLAHVVQAHRPSLPALTRLGLLASAGLPGPEPAGAWGRMAERSAAKDTLSGHFELCGVVTETPFPVYPCGFPADLIAAFSRAVGRPVLGNKAASGTDIILELGEEQVRTGGLIVYTSADSVFQVAAHEEVVPVEELYAACRTARRLLDGPHRMARVIARPFGGGPGAYARTAGRKDFGVAPPAPTLLDAMAGAGLDVVALGKIEDIFSGQGITASHKTRGNEETLARLLALKEEPFEGLAFVNLIDFDMEFGHRNDAAGFAGALEALDRFLPAFLELGPGDLVLLTADHGCDPLHPGTDHTREYVPVLAWHARCEPAPLGTRDTFADLGQTIAENFGLHLPAGKSFLSPLATERGT